MTDYAPLNQIRFYIEPHHVAQIVNEAAPVYRDCIIVNKKNSGASNDWYVRLCEIIHFPYKARTTIARTKFQIFATLLNQYEGIMVDQTLIIRKIDLA
jgi:hypothetical protein